MKSTDRNSEPSPQLSDEAILDLFWARDERALSACDRKYGTYLMRMAENILHNIADSEECRNDVYLKLWNTIPPARPAVLPAYLNRVMRGTAIDRYRERCRRGRVDSSLTASLDELADLLTAPDTVESEVESAELGRSISAYLRTQSKRRQYLFVARYFRAETVEDIAHTLGISASAVYKELRKIRRGLQEYLERNGFSL